MKRGLCMSVAACCVAVWAVVLPASPARAGDLVVNGSFESPSIAPAFFALFPAIPGWTATAGGLELQRNGIFGPGSVAFDGQQWHEIDRAAGATGIFQDLATVPGQVYVLSFAYAPRPGTAPTENVFSVLWGGATVATFGPLTPPAGSVLDWQVASILVTATGSSTRLQFDDLGGAGSVGALLDDVSVVGVGVVPEPSALSLAGIGAVSLIACTVLRRRSRSGGPLPRATT